MVKKKKKIMTQPNPLTLKNQLNPMGWVASDQFWQVRCTLLIITLVVTEVGLLGFIKHGCTSFFK